MRTVSRALFGVLAAFLAGCSAGSSLLPPTANPNVSQEKFDRLKEGMTQAEVEQVLGAGAAASDADIERIHFGPDDISARHNFKMKEMAGAARCFIWSNAPLYIFVVYDKPPAEGGKLTYAELVQFIEAPGGAKEVQTLGTKGILWSDA